MQRQLDARLFEHAVLNPPRMSAALQAAHPGAERVFRDQYLEFYPEALDRDVRLPHERPSIGVLLCASKHAETVEYALARSMSPTLVAEYARLLPDKRLPEAELAEYVALSGARAGGGAGDRA